MLLGELSCAEGPEVDVRFTAGDDDGAVARVKVHSEHGLVGTLQHNNKPLVISTIKYSGPEEGITHMYWTALMG